MINKIISIFLIFFILTGSVSAEPFKVYSKSNDPHSLFGFKPSVIEENLFGLKFDIVFFPLENLPINMPKGFRTTDYGLFCLNVNIYDDMLTIVKTNKFNLDSVIGSERKNCKEKKENIRKGCQEREDSLKKKIKEVEGKLKKKTDAFLLKQAEYKSLEKKMFWVQIGSGAAILAISGFAIYSSQK